MDEPLSNLDAKLRLTMRGQLKHIQRKLETTTIYVTHDQIEAMTLADRIAVMSKGQIQQLGTPDEVYNDPGKYICGRLRRLAADELDQGQSQRREFLPGLARGAECGNGEAQERGAWHAAGRHQIAERVARGTSTPLYSLEPTGDQTLVAAKTDAQLIIARAARDFRRELGTDISFSFAPERVHLFDGDSGQRI